MPSDTEPPSSENMAPTEESGKFYDVETAVSAAILDKNMGRYLAGECVGEGHIILSTEEEKDQVTVYMLAMFGWYQFQDGNFVKLSGSGAIPTVMTFQREKDGSYLLSDYSDFEHTLLTDAGGRVSDTSTLRHMLRKRRRLFSQKSI